MKKWFYPLAAAVITLSACSSKEEPNMSGNGEVTEVTISANVPYQDFTRVTVDDKNLPGLGNKIAKMEYAIYDQFGHLVLASGQPGAPVAEKSEDDHGRYDLKVTLLKQHTYTFYLWASAAQTPYTFDPASKTVSIDYSKVKANDENMDAFFGKHTYYITDTQENDEQYMITLNRPFAQLNILVNDNEKAAALEKSGKIESVDVTVKQNPGKYSLLNLDTFVASTPFENAFTFHTSFSGWDDLVHAGDGDVAHYYYLTTCYLLTGITPDGSLKGKVGTGKELTDINISINYTDGTSIKINKTNVPIRRNWRTDIYGALETTDVDVNARIDFEFMDKYQDGPGATTGTGSDDGDHSNDNNDTQEDL